MLWKFEGLSEQEIQEIKSIYTAIDTLARTVSYLKEDGQKKITCFDSDPARIWNDKVEAKYAAILDQYNKKITKGTFTKVKGKLAELAQFAQANIPIVKGETMSEPIEQEDPVKHGGVVSVEKSVKAEMDKVAEETAIAEAMQEVKAPEPEPVKSNPETPVAGDVPVEQLAKMLEMLKAHPDLLKAAGLAVAPTQTPTQMSNGITVTKNTAKKGVELRFPARPEQKIIDLLNNNDWRYTRSNSDPRWYHKDTAENLELANMIATGGVV